MNKSTILDHIFPSCCLLCGAPATRWANLCGACERDLPRLPGATCPRCAAPGPAPGTCGRCYRQPPPFDTTRAALQYREPVPGLVHRYKFNGDLCAGAVFAALLAETVDADPRPDCLVPVPSAPARRRQHGFDPGLELARMVARRLHVPMEHRAARRVGHRPPQSSLPNWRSRWSNVSGVFHVEPRRVAGRTVALVDDVMTSGATVTALSAALRDAGATRIDVWVSCRAGMPGAMDV